MKEKIKTIDTLSVKYRPKTFDDIVGNKTSIGIIKGFLSKRQLPRTWLLVGEPGCGKTTIARILARTINCMNIQGINPCNDCESCKLALIDMHPDIKEMNASSEEGNVEEIRNVLKTAKLKARYNMRVFILDEVHGLSSKAREGLLKPLEEPPQGTVWILCTTAPEKLPDAVYGRCQKLFLSYPTMEEMKTFLSKVVKKEYGIKKLKKVKKYLSRIIESAGYQPRDSLSILEQVCVSNDKDAIKSILKTNLNTDIMALKFVSYLSSNKKFKPMEIALSFANESYKIDDFINRVYKYSTYGIMFYLSRKGNVTFDKRLLQGINYVKWESVLDKLIRENKVTDKNFMKLNNIILSVMENLKMGIISKDKVLTYIVIKYFL